LKKAHQKFNSKSKCKEHNAEEM